MAGKVQWAAAEKSARLLSLAASPVRLMILQLATARDGAQVKRIAEALEMSQSAVSHQLRLLAEEGAVTSKKEGRTVTYTLSRAATGKRIARLLRLLR